MSVRTHSPRLRQSTGLRKRLSWWECRGCGERWDIDTDTTALERQPCGTREGA